VASNLCCDDMQVNCCCYELIAHWNCLNLHLYLQFISCLALSHWLQYAKHASLQTINCPSWPSRLHGAFRFTCPFNIMRNSVSCLSYALLLVAEPLCQIESSSGPRQLIVPICWSHTCLPSIGRCALAQIRPCLDSPMEAGWIQHHAWERDLAHLATPLPIHCY